MRRHHKHQLSEYDSTVRIEAFTDGVMAIIITIMVLELRVPQLAEKFTREAFWEAAEHLAPKLIAYAMSFVIVAIYWVNHHDFYHRLVKSDGKLMWYNNFLLFWLSLVPFGTSFLGEHPMQMEALMFFGILLLMSGISFMLMAYYCLFTAYLVDEHLTRAMRWRGLSRNFPGVALYLIAVIAAPFSPWTSWVIFFIVPVYYFLPIQLNESQI
jgi:uncharacterized membrane protein